MAPVIPLRIGNLQLATNLVLAPMAGYCELPFRLVARACGGIGLAFTPLLSPKGVIYGTQRTRDLAATCPEDHPLALQFYGGDPAELAQAARWAEDRGAQLIDINMGCSVPKVIRNNGGSRLLCDPDATLRLVDRVVASVRHTPVTAKLRLGWDDAHIVAPQLAARLEQAGVAAITIHGRTAAMKFRGKCRLDGIAAVVAAVNNIPVIGNGDVRTPYDAEHMIRETHCHGVMIGRGALMHPWIFRDTWSYLTTGAIPPPPAVEEKCNLMRRHFRTSIQLRGERFAVLAFRKFGPWYGKYSAPGRVLREQMPRIQSAVDFENVLARYADAHLSGASRPDDRAGHHAAGEPPHLSP